MDYIELLAILWLWFLCGDILYLASTIVRERKLTRVETIVMFLVGPAIWAWLRVFSDVSKIQPLDGGKP